MLTTIRQSIVEIASEPSGFVNRQKSLPLVWVAGLLGATAMFLGGTDIVQADCYEQYYCSSIPCPNDPDHYVLVDNCMNWIACACEEPGGGG